MDYFKKQKERNELIRAQMRGDEPIKEFGVILSSHSGSSMLKEGVYPDGMDRDEVEEKVKGTFGGRFEFFGNGKFKYIAYTD